MDNGTSFDPASGEYPTDVYAARLRWLIGSSDVDVWTEDWRAGPLAVCEVGVHRLAYGGDVAEEGAIGVTLWDAEGESVHLPGITDAQGWIGADTYADATWTWDAVREAVRRIPGYAPFA